MTCYEKSYGFSIICNKKCTKRASLVKKSNDSSLDFMLTHAMMDLTSTISVKFLGSDQGNFVGRHMRGIKKWRSLSDHFAKTYNIFREVQSLSLPHQQYTPHLK